VLNSVRNRLSYRLTRDTVLVAMTLGLILNLIQITLDFFSAEEAMDRDIQALLEISHSPASQIAYNIDIRLAEELLNGLLRHPATIDARIIDSEGKTMSAASQSSPVSPYRWISDMLFGPGESYHTDLKVPQLQDLPLGQLAVTIDTYHYGWQFMQRAASTLLMGILKSLALSAALLAIFYFVLTRPMLNVINALGKVHASAPEKIRLPVPTDHRSDEIGTMVGIINEHLENMENSVARLRSAESAMKNYSSELEQEVADRTREILEKNEALQRGNRALVRAKEDAVHRARSRANFLASMSHEIRTPLNGVLGMLDLALEHESDPGQKNRLEIAQNAGESLLGLLNDILDISKVEAGKLNMERIPFSVRLLVEECAAIHAQQARRRHIDLVNETDPVLPDQFLGDPTRTRQILNNLLSNAVKFTDDGSVRVRASHSSGNLRLEVIDTGIGISRQGLRRIFSPFSQADSDTTRLYGGTGLGLTLCRQLVERMHGQITVDSREGRGTHFTVTLPLKVNRPASDCLPRNEAKTLRAMGIAMAIPQNHPHRLALESQLRAWAIPVRSASRHPQGILLMASEAGAEESLAFANSWQGKGVIIADTSASLSNNKPDQFILALPLRRSDLMNCLLNAAGLNLPHPDKPDYELKHAAQKRQLRILLVEDNQVNQLVASSLLKKLGHRVEHAENGQRALEALRNRRYDLILMDCQMPVMDGYEATRAIRNNPEWQNLPVIAVTANVMQGDREDCLASGMNDYITKPYRREDLKAVIRRWTSPDQEPPEVP